MGKQISPAVAVIAVLVVVVVVAAIGYFVVLKPKTAAGVGAGADDGVYGPEDMGPKAKMDAPAGTSPLPSGAPSPQ